MICFFLNTSLNVLLIKEMSFVVAVPMLRNMLNGKS